MGTEESTCDCWFWNNDGESVCGSVSMYFKIKINRITQLSRDADIFSYWYLS